jgi:hypothetical protein
MTNYDLELNQGDFGWGINFTVNKKDGTAKDLTGLTVTWKIWNDNGLHLSGGCTLVDAAQGKCKYTLQDGDFDDLEEYNWLLQLTKTGYKKDTKTYSAIVEPTAPDA